MSSSDWLAIVLTLVGILGGFTVSWIFFRTQLLADFGSLRATVLERMSEIQTTQSGIVAKLDMDEKLQKHDDVASIRETVGRIEAQLRDALKSVIGDVKEQQVELAAKIQQQFHEQSQVATAAVKGAFESEIRKYIEDARNQDRLLQSLIASFMEGLRVMGNYQEANITKQSEASLITIKEKIAESFEEIFTEVVELKETIPALSAPDRSEALEPPEKSIERDARAQKKARDEALTELDSNPAT